MLGFVSLYEVSFLSVLYARDDRRTSRLCMALMRTKPGRTKLTD